MASESKVTINFKPEPEPVGNGFLYKTPSTSEPGRIHFTFVGLPDDKEYVRFDCSCPGFQFNGGCWHVRQIRSWLV